MIYFAGAICADGCKELTPFLIISLVGSAIVITGLLMLPFIFKSEATAKRKEQEAMEDEIAQAAEPASLWQYPTDNVAAGGNDKIKKQ